MPLVVRLVIAISHVARSAWVTQASSASVHTNLAPIVVKVVYKVQVRPTVRVKVEVAHGVCDKA